MANWNYGNSTESNLMKVKYGKIQNKQFNTDSIVYGLCKKNTNFVGSQIEFPVRTSIGGGVGSGSLPSANRNQHKKAIITSKKLYGRAGIDRESKFASKNDEGSFVRFTKYSVEQLTQSFVRNFERMATRGDASGSGVLITGNAGNANVSGQGISSDPTVISFSAASTYFPAEFESIEIGDILNCNSETSELEVVDMSVTVSGGYATGTISLVGSSTRLDAINDNGTPAPFIASDKLYMQGSKDNEMIGIKGAIEATGGTLYNISVGRRWQAYQKTASAALTTDLINEMVMNIKRQCGRSPKMILSSFHQYEKLLNLLEDHKRYALPVRDKSLKGKLSFNSIMVATPEGDIPVMVSRFLDSDEMFFLNFDHIELHLRHEFKWFDEDGSVFLRESTDSYEGRYGSYGQLYINPHFQGILKGLSL